ncbi:hypothetical protein [uncultured Flavobacterium sp.]|uniref:hypothetical protein n=1 Tax=uncultured Flavobacterium sp. TaxID=165435 RepID=UPI0025EC0DE2|nr:hypothetical protein [uncultured Flavobacterium sp.]
MKKLRNKIALMLLLAFTTFSCESTRTAVFDQYSYQKTTELKVETSKLMDKATTPYSKNLAEVEALFLNIEKLAEYEKNKPDNQITFAMWTILTDKEKNLLGGFFKRWKEKETLTPVFLEESKNQVLEAMDLLIQYEIKKDKQSKDSLLDLISKN